MTKKNRYWRFDKKKYKKCVRCHKPIDECNDIYGVEMLGVYGPRVYYCRPCLPRFLAKI